MIRYIDRQNKRLIYSGVHADKKMWEQRWKAGDISRQILIKRVTAMDKVVLDMTKKYLSPRARILEGGCGLGRYVNFLDTNGFQVIGVDNAKETIQRVKDFMPELDVRVADLRDLPFEDEYFDGYWSFGVIEHFIDGYDEIAREMKRVVKSGGYLFMEVPAFSRLRMLKASLGLFREYPNQGKAKEEFYQYAFSSSDICHSFSEYGFDLITKRGINVLQGITDEIPYTRLVMRILYRFLDRALEQLMGSFANHVDLFVFKKR